MHCVFDSLCEMHSLVFVLNRSKVKATFETAFEIVFETFHATFNVFVVKDSSDLKKAFPHLHLFKIKNKKQALLINT